MRPARVKHGVVVDDENGHLGWARAFRFFGGHRVTPSASLSTSVNVAWWSSGCTKSKKGLFCSSSMVHPNVLVHAGFNRLKFPSRPGNTQHVERLGEKMDNKIKTVEYY
jgi:hypothetical protein